MERVRSLPRWPLPARLSIGRAQPPLPPSDLPSLSFSPHSIDQRPFFSTRPAFFPCLWCLCRVLSHNLAFSRLCFVYLPLLFSLYRLFNLSEFFHDPLLPFTELFSQLSQYLAAYFVVFRDGFAFFLDKSFAKYMHTFRWLPFSLFYRSARPKAQELLPATTTTRKRSKIYPRTGLGSIKVSVWLPLCLLGNLSARLEVGFFKW